MSNKCSKAIKEALSSLDEFGGIQMTYKIDDVINGLPDTQKFSSKQLEGYLRKRGVSPKEIKQSGVITDLLTPNEVQPAKVWKERLAGGRHRVDEKSVEHPRFEEISMRRGGVGNPSYQEKLAFIDEPTKYSPDIPHFGTEVPKGKSLLGWRRTHEAPINGKPTTVLNELQSDWAQTERAGRGKFASKDGALDRDEVNNRYDELLAKLNSTYAELEKNYQISMSEAREHPEIKAIREEITKVHELKKMAAVADFPMSEQKFYQYQIVATLDEAIGSGTNRVAIPIKRTGDLQGTEGVTKFYDNLNKKILPEIRKKLEKQGLRIKLSKEESTLDGDTADKINNLFYGNVDENTADVFFDDIEDLLDQVGYDIQDFISQGFNWNDVTKAVEGTKVEAAVDRYGEVFSKYHDNTVHVIEIEEIPNKPVKWDVYGVLSAIGLGPLADKLKEGEEN